MRISPVGAELLHGDGQTRRLTVTLRNFANEPKKLQILCTKCSHVHLKVLTVNSDYFPKQHFIEPIGLRKSWHFFCGNRY
jgi:hypothetical protein